MEFWNNIHSSCEYANMGEEGWEEGRTVVPLLARFPFLLFLQTTLWFNFKFFSAFIKQSSSSDSPKSTNPIIHPIIPLCPIGVRIIFWKVKWTPWETAARKPNVSDNVCAPRLGPRRSSDLDLFPVIYQSGCSWIDPDCELKPPQCRAATVLSRAL